MQLGKPTLNDLRSGLATAPVLYAAEEYPELNTLILRRFKSEGGQCCVADVRTSMLSALPHCPPALQLPFTVQAEVSDAVSGNIASAYSWYAICFLQQLFSSSVLSCTSLPAPGLLCSFACVRLCTALRALQLRRQIFMLQGMCGEHRSWCSTAEASRGRVIWLPSMPN